VEVRTVTDAIRPIHSGLPLRGETPAESTSRLIEFTRSQFADTPALP
jgi:hypothetical protein